MSRQAAAHYKAHGMPGSDQAAVWSEVARKMTKTGYRSLSGALQEMYKNYANRLEEVLAKICAPSGCQGAASVIDGKSVAADLFESKAR